ncbi:MAG: hypothetical protein BAJALOKI3v1_210017 [Promethearchaeota archaeon]|nr:MAG: hypothetical protein BAJALOKI3v1_210017 [Candidatus Lokiarchaeota archaeon]
MDLKLINNTFGEKRQVAGFSKDELVEIKRKISDFKSGKLTQTEVMELLQRKFPEDLLEEHSKYIENIENFINTYLKQVSKSQNLGEFNFFYLKKKLLEEIDLISNNLLNLKLNCQNSKRFLKDHHYLNDYISRINLVFEKTKELQSSLQPIGRPPLDFEDLSRIWFDMNKLKNFKFKMKKPIEDQIIWEEISNLYDYLTNKGEKEKKGGIFSKKELEIIFYFKILNNYISNLPQKNADFYLDLLFLLHKSDLLSVLEEQEFSNILERKEAKDEIRRYLRSIIKEVIRANLEEFIQEVYRYEEKTDYEGGDIQKTIEDLLEKKIKILLPKFIDLYFNGLEKHYLSIIANSEDFHQFETIINEYSNNIDGVYESIENIKVYTNHYKPYLDPYEEMLESLHKIFSNLLDNIYRRKEEFIYHLEAIQQERMKQEIRTYTSEKIEELNSLIENYRDEVAVLLKQKMPHLESIEGIINTYKHKINKIKDDVYSKLKEQGQEDLDQYQIIKNWEENYKRRKEQIGFLLSQYLTNLYKDFEGLIEKEEALFNRIKDISQYGDEQDEVPLNYAFSSFLANKLTEDEMRERMVELKAKINSLNHLKALYEDELSHLEDTLKTKVKIREGIATSNVQCGVCRKEINFADDKIIKCPFCDAVYHYLCVAFWLSKYNSCPSCQNAFLDPNQSIYETQQEE